MIAIASDHGDYRLKEHIRNYLAAKNIACQDFDTDSTASCDYHDIRQSRRTGCCLQPVRKRVSSSVLPALVSAIIGEVLAERIVDIFLNTEFEGTERHARRVALVEDYLAVTPKANRKAGE